MSKSRWAPWDDSLKDQDDVRRLALRDMQKDLLFASVEIGGIVNLKYWAQEGLTARVQNSGRQVRDLTVGELMDMLKVQQTFHARIEEKLTIKWRRRDDQQG
nr:hypothetical protein [uncultured Desulfobacter sp.]